MESSFYDDYDKVDIMEIMEKAIKNYPTFPDGSIDYTNADVVIKFSAVLISGGQILLFKKSGKDYWEGITGYIDRFGKIEDIIIDEIKSETSLAVDRLELGTPFELKCGSKTCIIQPAVAHVSGKPKLDWEHSEWKAEKIQEIDVKLSEVALLTIEKMMK